MTVQNNFQNWCSEHPDFVSKRMFGTEGPSCKWGRLETEWREKKIGSNEPLIHKVALVFNRETGDYYLDCSKKKIYVKMLANFLLRPIDGLIRTLFHVCVPLSIGLTCYITIDQAKRSNRNLAKKLEKYENESTEEAQQEAEKLRKRILTPSKIFQKCINNSLKSLSNIVRTPVYSVAMTIVSLAAVIVGPLAPKTLYDFREMQNKLLRSYHRMPEGQIFDITPCFTTIGSIQKEYLFEKPFYDVDYSQCTCPTDKAFSNYACLYISSMRENRRICNNGGRRLGKNEIYTSPAAADIEKIKSIYAMQLDPYKIPEDYLLIPD